MKHWILGLAACAALAAPAAPAAAEQVGNAAAAAWAKELQPRAVSPLSPAVPPGRADDYVSIVNLLNTYFIALDAGDIDTYVGLFTPDAKLYWAGGVEEGTAAIRKNISNFGTGRQKTAKDATDRLRFIHTLGSQRIDFPSATTAHDVGMWFGFTNEPDRTFKVAEFGHYEDFYVKVKGRWYFKARRIYNERGTNRALFYTELGEPDPRQ